MVTNDHKTYAENTTNDLGEGLAIEPIYHPCVESGLNFSLVLDEARDHGGQFLLHP